MPPNKNTLLRTTYSDPTNSDTPRTGDVGRGTEALIDANDYHQPLEKIHAGGAHEGGVLSGLKVTAVLNSPGVKIETGAALDMVGRHISLASGGKAETDPKAQDPSTPSSNLVDVSDSGMSMPTNGPFDTVMGVQCLTLQWLESFDDGLKPQGIYRMLHTPWVRFKKSGTVDLVQDVVLAVVTCDLSGNVTKLEPGPPPAPPGETPVERRRGTGLPVEQIHFKMAQQTMAQQTSNQEVQDAAWAEIHSRAGGGLSIEVADSRDTVEIQQVPDIGDAKRNFQQLTVGAQIIAARRNSIGSGAETLRMDVDGAKLWIGTGGSGAQSGSVHVVDSNGGEAIALTSIDATIRAEGSGKTSSVIVVANAKKEMAKLDGAHGDVWFRNQVKDLGAPNLPGPNGDQFRKLISGNVIDLHKHDVGVLAQEGQTGARIGVITGEFGLPATSEQFDGTVTLNFETRAWTGQPVPPSAQSTKGYKGKFATNTAPQILQSITQLWMTSDEDVHFFVRITKISATSVTFQYHFDEAMVTGWQRVAFLAIGAIE